MRRNILVAISLSATAALCTPAGASRACFATPTSPIAAERRVATRALSYTCMARAGSGGVGAGYGHRSRHKDMLHPAFLHGQPSRAFSRLSCPALSTKASVQDEYNEEEEEEERLERNEQLVEAYSELAGEIRSNQAGGKGGRLLVEVALDAPERWLAEVVAPRISRITSAGNLSAGKRVLDVGTGAGGMIESCLKDGGVFQEDIVGVDLCAEMLEIAQDRFPDVTLVQGDIVDLELEDMKEQGEEEEETAGGQAAAAPAAPAPFDAVFLTSVFATLSDQKRALEHVSTLAARGSRVVIGHPLGSAFVKTLNAQDDFFTPNLLPSRRELDAMVKHLAYSVASVEDEEEFYLATLDKLPHAVMPSSLFMRGPVATGYGRGGKKLGVPTANLPQSLFKDSLANVKTGVYCGWASVDQEGGKTATCKAVVNVGYSPTFVGEENREKIVEAHLMGYEGGDFYDSEMRLILSGFQRGEKKFASFPDLVAAINQDIQDAKDALDTPELAALSKHPYLRKDSGMSNWMVQPYEAALTAAKI